ncbi:MAG: 50S ribosomal protein L35 [Patescibacteria group bacterium]|nr:50S ribosomal protein L35 [Patescibacteria group bacterium]
MKTNKSYSKRLRVTKTGKLMARKTGQNHFNAKASRPKQLAKRQTTTFEMKNKDIGRYLPNLVKK